jgi:hypothetical protein
MADQARLSRLFDIVLTATFVGAIFIPFAGLWVKSSDLAEMRTLAQFPIDDLSWSGMSRLPVDLTAYANDRFGARDALLNLQSRIAYHVFGKSASPKVMIGKQKWMFYAAERSVEDIQRIDLMPPDLADLWRRSTESRARWLKAKGIVYRVYFAPDKHSIYADLLPTGVAASGPSRFDGLLSKLGPKPYLIDGRGPLLNARAIYADRLYLHTDTHWTHLGAYVGYKQIISSLGDDMRHRPLQAQSFTSRPLGESDLSRMARIPTIDMDEVASNLPADASCVKESPAVAPQAVDSSKLQKFATTHCATGHGTVLIFHDSFMSAMEPYISSQFREVTYVRGSRDDFLFARMVDQLKPDIVIDEYVERAILIPPSDNLEQALKQMGQTATSASPR